MDDKEALLHNTARDQFGVFTLAQSEACGFARSTISRRASRRIYERLYPGVYGIAGSQDSWYRKAIAAVFSARYPACASHWSAAYLWGMTSRCPDVIEVTSRRHQRVQRLAFTLHESKDILESDIVQVDGIPVTSAVRTVVDLGASAPPWMVERCLDSGLRRGLFTAWQVRCFIARVARPGRNGVGTIRPLVEERLEWASITDSDLEDLVRAVIKSTGLPMPELQHDLFRPDGSFVGRYDFAYVEKLSIIEADSWRFHMDPVSFERDRQKQNEAIALGWTVYRITWRQLIDDPESVRAIIRKIWED
jgi:hypothetical protein